MSQESLQARHGREAIPLRLTLPNVEIHDMETDRLPSYGEATTPRLERPPSTEPTTRVSTQTEIVSEAALATVSTSTSPKLPPKKHPPIIVRFWPCLLLPLLILVTGAVALGIVFVDSYTMPSPPNALPSQSDDRKKMFGLFTIIFGFLAYPFTLAFLLIVFPSLFCLPSRFFRSRTQWFWKTGSDEPHFLRWKCCGICLLLTILYVAAIVLTLWGVVFQYAQKQLEQSTGQMTTQDWVGNWVTIEKTYGGSNATFYDATGDKVGNLPFEQLSNAWSFQINGPAGPTAINNLLYLNATEDRPITFNASCPGLPGGLYAAVVLGGLTQQPVLSNSSDSSGAEYVGYINITIFSSMPNVLNITLGETSIWTSGGNYQGIGLNYPPLGTWFVDNEIAVQVAWSTESTRACEGLQIVMANDFKGIGWIILGFVWEWWIAWGMGGGCDWN